MATLSGRTVGEQLPFAILLRDRTPAFRGTCIILDSWSDANNPFGRPGLRVGFARLSAGSEAVLARLLAARREAGQESRPRAPTVEAVAGPPQVTVRVPAIGRATAPLRGIASVAAIAVDGSGVAVQARAEASRVRPSPRAMTAPLRGDDAPFTSEEPTERMVEPPVMAEGTAPVNLPPSTHFAARPVTVSGMIQPRAPGSKIVLPANPLMNLTDASLGGFVDETLDYLLGTEPAPEPEPPREIARGTADHFQPVVAEPRLAPLEDEHTQIVTPLPHARGVSWIMVIAAFAAAAGIGFAASYLATTLI